MPLFDTVLFRTPAIRHVQRSFSSVEPKKKDSAQFGQATACRLAVLVSSSFTGSHWPLGSSPERSCQGFEKTIFLRCSVSWANALHNGEIPLGTLSFRRPSGDRRSAIPDLHPDHAAVCIDRAKRLDAAFRRCHPRTSSCRRSLHPWPIAALELASSRRGAGSDRFHAGRRASSRLQHTGIHYFLLLFSCGLMGLDIALERRSYRFAIAFGSRIPNGARPRSSCLPALRGSCWLSCLFRRSIWTRAGYLRARAGILTSSAVLILAILSVPALLTMQFLADSNRPGFPFGVAAVGSLAPVNLITLFVPNFFGSLDHLYDYWGLTTTPCRAPIGPTAPSIIFLSAPSHSCSLPGMDLEPAGYSLGARDSSSSCWCWRPLMRWGAIPHSSRSHLTEYPAYPSIGDRRRDISDQISRCFAAGFLAAPLYRGRAATALPHAAEMAGPRTHWGNHAFARGADRHRNRLFLAGRPPDKFACRARGAGMRPPLAPPSCWRFKRARSGRSRQVCSCF